MFTIFNKKPEIHVDAFTYNSSVYEFTPITKAVDCIPDFWRALPMTPEPRIIDTGNNNFKVVRNTTLKNCMGIINLYKTGFILQNWTSITIKVKKNGEGYNYFCSFLDKPTDHPLSQFGTGFKNFQHIKLISPWLLDEKKGINFHYAPASWSHEKYDFIIPPGILDFKLNRSTHVNIMLRNKPEDYQITFEFGDPLIHMIPLTEKKVTLKTHLVTKQEYDSLQKYTAHSFYGWNKISKIIRKNEKNSECPFHK